MYTLLNLQRLKPNEESFDYVEASCTSCGAGSCNSPEPTNP